MSNTALAITKNFVPVNKPVFRLLRNTSCKSEFFTNKIQSVNHLLYRYFLSGNPIPLVPLVDVVNFNVKFTPLHSCVHVVKSFFRPQRVSVLKAPQMFIVNTVLHPNIFNAV